MDEKIVQQIEQILRLENVTMQGFSRILFGFGGLFYQLGPTEAERRAIVQTDLFQRANARMNELVDRESAQLDARRPVVVDSPNGAPKAPQPDQRT